jgi:hypothetical protein
MMGFRKEPLIAERGKRVVDGACDFVSVFMHHFLQKELKCEDMRVILAMQH